MADVSAIYKKGDCHDPKNYRPVSLTSVPCKLMEHIIFHSVMVHNDKHSILVNYQHGFRSGHSTESQLVVTVEDIAKSLDDRGRVDALVLDFSKAFDTVPHQRLMKKLHHYGIRGCTWTWIQNWLIRRTQRVVVDRDSSDTVPVISGVPQGTVLGPLLFLLYINDIASSISSVPRLFADDCLLYRVIHSEDDQQILQDNLTRMVEWSTKWQMLFNADKCHAMTITRKRNPPKFDYSIKGTTLLDIKHHPYLGVELDHQLSWKNHIQNVTTNQ